MTQKIQNSYKNKPKQVSQPIIEFTSPKVPLVNRSSYHNPSIKKFQISPYQLLQYSKFTQIIQQKQSQQLISQNEVQQQRSYNQQSRQNIINEVYLKLNEKQQQIRVLTQRINLMKNTNQCLRQTIQEQKVDNENLNKIIELLGEQIQLLKKRTSKLQQQKTQYQFFYQNQHEQQNNKTLKQQLSILQQHNRLLKRQIHNLKKYYEQQIQSKSNKLQTQLHHLNHQKNKLNEQIDNLNRQILYLRHQNDNLMLKIQQIMKQKIQSLEKHLQIIEEMKKQFQDMKNYDNYYDNYYSYQKGQYLLPLQTQYYQRQSDKINQSLKQQYQGNRLKLDTNELLKKLNYLNQNMNKQQQAIYLQQSNQEQHFFNNKNTLISYNKQNISISQQQQYIKQECSKQYIKALNKMLSRMQYKQNYKINHQRINSDNNKKTNNINDIKQFSRTNFQFRSVQHKKINNPRKYSNHTKQSSHFYPYQPVVNMNINRQHLQYQHKKNYPSRPIIIQSHHNSTHFLNMNQIKQKSFYPIGHHYYNKWELIDKKIFLIRENLKKEINLDGLKKYSNI